MECPSSVCLTADTFPPLRGKATLCHVERSRDISPLRSLDTRLRAARDDNEERQPLPFPLKGKAFALRMNGRSRTKKIGTYVPIFYFSYVSLHCRKCNIFRFIADHYVEHILHGVFTVARFRDRLILKIDRTKFAVTVELQNVHGISLLGIL